MSNESPGEGLVSVERTGRVATVRLRRASHRNALTREMIEELRRIAMAFRDDEQTRVVVFRGDGADFCAGADLAASGEAANRGPEQSLLMRQRSAERGTQMIAAIHAIPQPTICLLQGASVGSGACLAVACDFRIADPTTRLVFGEVLIGMNLMWRALPLIVQLVGPARAKRLAMAGEAVDPATLLQWGLYDQLVAEGELDAAGQALAERYADLPPIAAQMIKRSVNALSGALSDAITHMDTDQWLLTTMTADCKEGVAAFLERRKPTFTGA